MLNLKQIYVLILAIIYVAVGLYIFWDRYGEELTNAILPGLYTEHPAQPDP
jgi:hypothetical protein